MTRIITASQATAEAGAETLLPEERTGRRLFFYDDFKDDVPKVIGVDAVAGEIDTFVGTEGTVTPFSGTKMLRVDNVGAADATVYYQFGRIADNKMGIKLRWWKNSDISEFELIVEHFDKVTAEVYKLKFVEATMDWWYWNSAGAYVAVTTGEEDIADNCWNEVYITLDLTNVQYGKLVTNGISKDLSTIGAETGADAVTEGSTKITFGATTGAANKAAYVDEFVLYVNEE